MFNQGMIWPFVQGCIGTNKYRPVSHTELWVLVCGACKALLGLPVLWWRGARSPGRPAAVLLTQAWTSALPTWKMCGRFDLFLFPSCVIPMAWRWHRQFPNTSKRSPCSSMWSFSSSDLLSKFQSLPVRDCAALIPVSKRSLYLRQQQ